MKFAIVDDEEHAIEKLKSVLEKVKPESEINTFMDADDFLEFLRESAVDVAFLDVEMPGMDGLELTKRIKDLHTKTGVIFVTGHSEHALEAHGLYVSGFLLKPVNPERVLEALDYLRPIVPVRLPHIRVQCYGNFDVFVDGNVISFPRSKSKELLAYLVHNQGTGVTTAEVAAVLWEDKPNDRSLRSQTQTVIATMMQTLRSAGAAEMVVKKTNMLMVDVSKFECDSYNFMKWDTRAYAGNYMRCYSWAETSSGIPANLK